VLLSAMRKVVAPGRGGRWRKPVLTSAERIALDEYLERTEPMLIEAILQDGLRPPGRPWSEKRRAAYERNV